jgi:transposase
MCLCQQLRVMSGYWLG